MVVVLFIVLQKKKLQEDTKQFFYNMESAEEGKDHVKKRRKIEFDLSKCWFCLASDAVEKHLIIAIGNHSYVALAKGKLTFFPICIVTFLMRICLIIN